MRSRMNEYVEGVEDVEKWAGQVLKPWCIATPILQLPLGLDSLEWGLGSPETNPQIR
jgi:hypothetical protein